MKQLHKVTTAVGLLLALAGGVAHAMDEIKIGFLVKQAEEPWFQDEWKFADQAAREKGFKLVKIGVPNGDKVLTAIDNLSAQHAQGFIICAPDVKLGSAIVAKAAQYKLKVMSVDDRLVDGAGKPIDSVPHMGISAYKIGEQVGSAMAQEMKKRGWKMSEVGAIRLSFDQLPTAKDRTDGAMAALVAAGFPKANFINAPQAKTDTENAFNAANVAITQNPKYKHWLAFGLNDEAVLGAVRAAEGRGVKSDSIIGIGIGGSQSAMNEFAKAGKTGFFGTVLISPKRHGYETTLNMYQWIKAGKSPDKLTLTTGMLMTRDNTAAVRKEMGL
ncbi:arabinose ABC transporter substrate-binding protein [Paludibacterium yongneupense]|uniref:arabinose ABC transporter substrate-binding protein n=1 Tax=Paludibacterium yongneupense TaxID=400061 RepID=UPI00040B4736|nr:arabinose ABC transporter substrate-binding protein [Paludibacterium yongneupense]